MKHKLLKLITLGLAILTLSGCSEITNSPAIDENGEIIHIKNEDGKYTGEDGYIEYAPSKEWDTVPKEKGLQILDVFIYEGEKMSDVKAAFDNSEYQWNITYNPEADVDTTKSLDIYMRDSCWLTLEMFNYTDLDICFQDDATLMFFYVSDADLPQAYSRVMKDFILGDMTKLSRKQLEILGETMFADCDVAYFRKAQTDTDITYRYVIRYPLGVSETNEKRSSYPDRELGKEYRYTFKYYFADESVEYELDRNYSYYDYYLEKDYYDETFDTPAEYIEPESEEDVLKE